METDEGLIVSSGAGNSAGTTVRGGGQTAYECMPEILNFHAALPTQVGIIDSRYTVVNPINSIDDAKTIEFQINSHLNELIHPAYTFLMLTTRIMSVSDTGETTAITAKRKKADKPTEEEENPAKFVLPVNGRNHALFKNVKVRLNDVQIDGGDGLYAYRGDLENRLMCTREVKTGMMDLEGWDEENIAFEELTDNERTALSWQGDHIKAIDASTAFKKKGFNRRIADSWCSKRMYSIGQIHSEIFQQPKPLPPHTKLYVGFDLQDWDGFCVLSKDKNLKYTLKIESMKLLVRLIKLDTKVYQEMFGELQNGNNFLMPIRKVDMMFAKRLDTVDYSVHSLMPEGEALPRRIFIAFVSTKAYNGAVELDPFNYCNVKPVKFLLRVGGDPRPFPEVVCNRTNENDILMNLFSLLEGTGSLFEDVEMGINAQNYRYRNNIICFDLTHAKNPPGTTYEMSTNKPCELEMTIKPASDGETIPARTMIIYAEYDAELEFDRNGNVKKKTFGTGS